MGTLILEGNSAFVSTSWGWHRAVAPIGYSKTEWVEALSNQ